MKRLNKKKQQARKTLSRLHLQTAHLVEQIEAKVAEAVSTGHPCAKEAQGILATMQRLESAVAKLKEIV